MDADPHHATSLPAGNTAAATDALVAILRLAYSGELAAAYAYRGHWKSLAEGEDRARIRQIEAEEWHHRTQVGEMLGQLRVAPSRWAEVRAWWIGRCLGLLCHVSGWLAPMYGAGKLESRNVREYETAARHAAAAGHAEWIDCLLTMAEVEWDHEAFFRERVLSHPIGRRIRIWPALPPKPSIRAGLRTAHPTAGPVRT